MEQQTGSPEDLLSPREREAWREYERLLASGLRRDALRVLDSFIERVVAYPDEQRREWVYALCRERLDRHAGRRVWDPLPLQRGSHHRVEGWGGGGGGGSAGADGDE